MKVERTTFKVDGIDEPCIMISSDYDLVKVRVSKCYHYIGPDSLYVREFINGEFNAEEEWPGVFECLTDDDAINIANEFSPYIN